MLNKMNDKQIHTGIRIVMASIAIILIWFVIQFSYNTYLRTDKQSENAIQNAITDVEKNPTNIKKRVALADLLVEKGKRGEAIKQYKEALKISKKYEPALVGLGVAYLEDGQKEEALSTFSEEIEFATKGSTAQIDKYLEKAYYYKGKILLDKGDYKEAVLNLKKALEIFPNMSDTHYLLGKANSQLNKEKEATEHFKEALRFNPNFSEAKKELEELGKN